MSIMTRMTSLAAVMAVVAGAALASASPAAAKTHPIYNDKQNWRLVDQNGDRVISKKEWKWAEDHGYDRLNNVPKKQLTRDEYQRYFNQYLAYRHKHGENFAQNDWRNDNNRNGQSGQIWQRQTDGSSGRDH